MNKKQKISNALYWLAIIFSSLNFLAIVIIGWESIWSGKGIGSIAVPWFAAYGTVSTTIWLIAFLLNSNSKLTIAYWATIVAPILLFTLLPVRFYVGG